MCEKTQEQQAAGNDAEVMAPLLVLVQRMDDEHVLVCTGIRERYLSWEKVRASELPQYLARCEDLKGSFIFGIHLPAA